MKKNVNFEEKSNGLFRVTHGKKIVADNLRDETTAILCAHHYRHAPSLAKQLKLKTRDGKLTGRPFWGIEAEVWKGASNKWILCIRVDGNDQDVETFATRTAALNAIKKYGRDEVTVTNIMTGINVTVPRSEAHSSTCVSSETYWCS